MNYTTRYPDLTEAELSKAIGEVASCAFEGGSNYWADKVRFKTPDLVPDDLYASEALGLGQHLEVREIIDESTGEHEWHLLTRASLLEGCKTDAEKRGLTLERWLAECDSEMADGALQYALLGEIVYG